MILWANGLVSVNQTDSVYLQSIAQGSTEWVGEARSLLYLFYAILFDDSSLPSSYVSNGGYAARKDKVINETKDDLIVTEKLIVYPNPAKGSFTVEFPTDIYQEEISVQLFDASGKSISCKVSYDSNKVLVDLPVTAGDQLIFGRLLVGNNTHSFKLFNK